MTVKRMDHIGIVVGELEAAIGFFEELGLAQHGEVMRVEGDTVDRIVALEGVRSDIVFMKTPDGHSLLELTKFHSPPSPSHGGNEPANAMGIRHITFAVEGIDDIVARLQSRGAQLVGRVEQYEKSYRLCYLRGPEGIIVELAEQIGS